MNCNRVNVSFKQNQRDQALLSVVNSSNNKSEFIKCCIESYVNNTNNTNNSNINKKTKRKVTY